MGLCSCIGREGRLLMARMGVRLVMTHRGTASSIAAKIIWQEQSRSKDDFGMDSIVRGGPISIKERGKRITDELARTNDG